MITKSKLANGDNTKSYGHKEKVLSQVQSLEKRVHKTTPTFFFLIEGWTDNTVLDSGIQHRNPIVRCLMKRTRPCPLVTAIASSGIPKTTLGFQN